MLLFVFLTLLASFFLLISHLKTCTCIMQVLIAVNRIHVDWNNFSEMIPAHMSSCGTHRTPVKLMTGK